MSMHSQLYEQSERLTVINGESSILNELFRIYTDCQPDGQTVGHSVSQSDIQLLSPLAGLADRYVVLHTYVRCTPFVYICLIAGPKSIGIGISIAGAHELRLSVHRRSTRDGQRMPR
jgi:hypothetical protein